MINILLDYLKKYNISNILKDDNLFEIFDVNKYNDPIFKDFETKLAHKIEDTKTKALSHKIEDTKTKELKFPKKKDTKTPEDKSDFSNCTLINEKKSDYYNHTYDPSELLEKIKTLNISDNDKKLITDIINPNLNEHCCNCICISLYSNSNKKPEERINYLYNIRNIIITVANIKKYLKHFIVRLFFDTSIFKTLEECFSDYRCIRIYFAISCLLQQDNVELYLYSCDNFVYTRTLRIFSAAFGDTKTCIARDADGIVSVADCININHFNENFNNKILFINNFNTKDRSSNKYLSYKTKINESTEVLELSEVIDTSHYSVWLNSYEILLKNDNETFDNKFSFLDILAGCVGFNIQLNYNEFIRIIEKISDVINTRNDEKDEEIKKLLISTGYDRSVINTIFIDGFDEILLLELFQGLCRILYNKSDDKIILNVNELNQKVDMIFIPEIFILPSTPKHTYILTNTSQDEELANDEEIIQKIKEDPDLKINEILIKYSSYLLNSSWTNHAHRKCEGRINYRDLYFKKYIKYKNKYIKYKNISII